MSKQLSRINRAAVAAKVKSGGAITLAEAAVYYCFAYSVVRGWKAEGLPLLNGKLFDADFQEWRRRKVGLTAAPTPLRATRG